MSSKEGDESINKHSRTFKLLPDYPIQPDKAEDIRFGHHDIAQAIQDVICNTSIPLTIGLYGRWGVGKSTIANSVYDHFTHKKDFKAVFFDVWKYEQDSLRRQFLIQIDEQVFDGELKYKTELNQSLSTPFVMPFSDHLRIWGKSFFLSALFSLLTLGIILTFTHFVLKQCVDLLALFFGSTFLGSIISFYLESFQLVKGTAHTVRTDSAEGFEDYFNELLKKKTLSGKKLLVVLDNLDRVEDKKVVEILSTVKTFLMDESHKRSNVIFLIPCDYQSICQRLKDEYGQGFDSDEFLRKFFNISYIIPQFFDLDLLVYIKDLIKETSVLEFQDNASLENVIYVAFKDNPREIKQFLNSLTFQILLARRRQLGGVLHNISLLAGLLVIKSKYPDYYQRIESVSLRSYKDFRSIDERMGVASALYTDMYPDKPHLKDKIVESLRKFFELTPDTDWNVSPAFFTLNQSNEEIKLPEYKSFIQAIESADGDAAQKIFDLIHEEGKVNQLDTLLSDRLDKIPNPMFFIYLKSILSLLSIKQIGLRQFSNQAARLITEREAHLSSIESLIDPKIVFNEWYPNVEQNLRESIVRPFVNLLNSGNVMKRNNREYVKKLLSIVSKQPETFTFMRARIKEIIFNHYSEYPFLLEFESDESQKTFLDLNCIRKFVNSLSFSYFSDVKKLEKTLKFWNGLDMNQDVVVESIKKYEELIRLAVEKGDQVMMTKSVNGFFTYVQNKLAIIESIQDASIYEGLLKEIVAKICVVYDKVDEKERLEIIEAIDFFAKWGKNQDTGGLVGRLNDFILKSSDEVLNTLGFDQLLQLISLLDVKRSFLERSKSQPKILLDKELYKELSNDELAQIVLGLISQRKAPFKLLVLKKYDLDAENNKKILEKLIEWVPEMTKELLFESLVCLVKLGFSSSHTSIDKFKDNLLSYKGQDVKNLLEECKKYQLIGDEFISKFD